MTARPPIRRLLPIACALAALLGAAVPAAATAAGGSPQRSYGDSQPSGRYAAADSSSDPSQRFAVGSPSMTLAQQLALQYWGMNACGGQVTITWTQLDPDINAQSTWDNPSSAYDNPDQNTNCQIQFNPVVPYDWPMFCTVAIHEYGHLTGHPHVNDPNNVMNPYYVKPIGPCATTPDPSAPPAPPVAPAGHRAAAATTHRAVHAKPKHKRHRKLRHRRVRRHRVTRHSRKR